MGRLAQAAAHHTSGINAQAAQQSFSGAGAARHALRQHQHTLWVAAAKAPAQLAAAPQQPLHHRWSHGSSTTEASRRLDPQLQMGHRRSHKSSRISHHQRQLQLLLRHPADQGRADACGQGRQRMGPLAIGATPEQFGISSSGETAAIRGGTRC